MSELGLSAGIRPELGQNLTPQMRQFLGLLSSTTLELRGLIQQEMMTNPLIEDVKWGVERPMSEALPQEHVSDEISSRELDFTPDGDAAQRTLLADDADRDYFLGGMENFEPSAENGSVDPDAATRRQVMFDRQVAQETLQDHLLAQVAVSGIPEEQRELAAALIDEIDDQGYFRGSLPDIEMVLGVTEHACEEMLAKIASFDPLGCGGRTVRECLLFQMETLEDSPWEDEARALIDRHLEDLAAGRTALICRDLHITPVELPKVVAEIRKLNGRPGSGFAPKVDASNYVRPEVFVTRTKAGTWQVRVSDRDVPELRISKRYLKILEDPKSTPEAKSYVRERLRAAETLLDAIADRQETIRNIAQAIVDAQKDAFDAGSMTALHPLTMSQIAEKVGVHNTTISRTVRGKYASTPFGVVELRKFFVAGLATTEGTSVANVEVKERLRALIRAEDPANPLADGRLAQMLTDAGVRIARRTVAKYRGQLGIPDVESRRAR